MVGTLSKSKRVISIVIALILVMSITMIYESGASADSTHKSAKNQTDHKHFAQDEIKIKEIPTSDAMALRLIERAFDTKVATRAKHRITKETKVNLEASISPKWKQSQNWGGYYLKNDSIKNVRGDFNASHCTGGLDLTWVGIGGYDSYFLAQTGLNQQSMQLFYEIWSEDRDDRYMYVWGDPGDVNEDDEIHVSVQNWYGNRYAFLALDATTGDYYVKQYNITPNPAGECEWIVETPYDKNGNQFHMGNFDDVTFTNSYWWGNNYQTHPINYAGEKLHRVYMYNIYGEMMVPSALGAGGTSFTVHPY